MARAVAHRDHSRGGAGAVGRHPDEQGIGAARDAVAALPAVPARRADRDDVVGQPAQRREHVAATEIEVVVDEREAVAVVDRDVPVIVHESAWIRVGAHRAIGVPARDEAGGGQLAIARDERECHLLGRVGVGSEDLGALAGSGGIEPGDRQRQELVLDRADRAEDTVRHRELREHRDVRLAAQVVPGAAHQDVAGHLVARQERPDRLLVLAELVVRPGDGLGGVQALDHTRPALDVATRLPVERLQAERPAVAARVGREDVEIRQEGDDQIVAVRKQSYPAADGGIGEIGLHAEQRAWIRGTEITRGRRLRF